MSTPLPAAPKVPTARRAGLLLCHSCGRLNAATGAAHPRCERCHAPLHPRMPDSLQRSWALLIAAAILYLPANLLPVMHTGSIFGSQSDTIMSGVIFLANSGSWPLALIIFIASVAVPLAKLVALAWLLSSVQRRSTVSPRRRTQVYRIVEFIGRWSMVDIYVAAILVALVQFKTLATIHAGAGAAFFGAVVILTMLAAHSFDPRLIWDAMENNDER
jgi:paraquat-inducible protein A